MSNSIKRNAPPVDDATVVSLRLFAVISLFRAEHDIRWYLQGVHVLPNPAGQGVFLVATNGHQLAIAHDPEGRAPAPQILACSRAFLKAVQAFRSERPAHVVVRGGRVVALDDMHHEISVQPGNALLEGKYPAALAVLRPILDSSLQLGMLGHFDPTYIHRIGKAARLLRPADRLPLAHWTHPSGTLYTRFAGEKSLVVVTMNMRGEAVSREAAPDPLKAAIQAHATQAAEQAAAEAESKARELAANTVVNKDAEPAEVQP